MRDKNKNNRSMCVADSPGYYCCPAMVPSSRGSAMCTQRIAAPDAFVYSQTANSSLALQGPTPLAAAPRAQLPPRANHPPPFRAHQTASGGVLCRVGHMCTHCHVEQVRWRANDGCMLIDARAVLGEGFSTHANWLCMPGVTHLGRGVNSGVETQPRCSPFDGSLVSAPWSFLGRRRSHFCCNQKDLDEQGIPKFNDHN